MKAKFISSISVLLPMLLVNQSALAHDSAAGSLMHSFEHMMLNDPASMFAILVFMLIIIGVVKTGGNLTKTKKYLPSND